METAIDSFFRIFDTPVQAGAYLVLFCIALLAPGWRSLGIVAATLGTLSLWACVEVKRELDNAPGGAVVAAVFALMFVWVAAAGLWSGLATRAVLLSLRGRSWPISATLALVLAGFLLLPLTYAASIWHAEWVRRPPDAACLDGLHPVEIQGAIFHLPAAPFLTVWESATSLHLFAFQRSLREFCETSRRLGKPFRAVMLTLSTERTYWTEDPLRRRYCSLTNSRWGRGICSLTYPRKPEFLESVSVYSTAAFDHRRMLGSRGSHEGFLEWRDQALAENGSLQQQRTGIFDHYENPGGRSSRSYWVAADGLWRDPAGEPHTLSCFQSGPPGAVACETTYRLEAGPQITYVFGAPEVDLEAAAMRADRLVRDMLAELATAAGIK